MRDEKKPEVDVVESLKHAREARAALFEAAGLDGTTDLSELQGSVADFSALVLDRDTVLYIEVTGEIVNTFYAGAIELPATEEAPADGTADGAPAEKDGEEDEPKTFLILQVRLTEPEVETPFGFEDGILPLVYDAKQGRWTFLVSKKPSELLYSRLEIAGFDAIERPIIAADSAEGK